MNIREFLKKNKILFDGAFGTYFAQKNPNILPEKANLTLPSLVSNIHLEYIENGANLIRTNTFCSNTKNLGCDKEELSKNILNAYDIATKAASNKSFVACNISTQNISDCIFIADLFLSKGGEIFLFETLSELENVLPTIKYIKSKNPNSFVITQFCVNQHGYTDIGLNAQRLFENANQIEEIDAIGLNCGVGPQHILNILKNLKIDTTKYITALPNSSYPSVIQDRMMFLDNINYFSSIMEEISLYTDFLGGCCGTTPQYIKALKENINFDINNKIKNLQPNLENLNKSSVKKNGFFLNKKGKKLIAVELDPPKDLNFETLMETANYLKTKDVDIITFADSPSGRTRADSILMSIKAAREIGITVMPHICCRDKNAIAISSSLLGAHINDVRHLLVITGDPVPNSVRDNVKGVFNFDSVKLMNYIQEMNKETFAEDNFVYGGAINYARKNIDLEIERINKKIKAGADFFLTQPVFDNKDIETIKYIKQKVPQAKILVGIMPLVSLRNAMFIKNEIAGITIPDWVVENFSPEMDKKTAEKIGVQIAQEVMKKVSHFTDGYYFVIPFNRLSIAQALIK